MIYYDIKNSIFGHTVIAHTDKGICAVLFGNNPEKELEEMFPNEPLQLIYSPQFAQKITYQINNGMGLEGIALDFVSGTPFQCLVWENLRKIPEGTTITYSELAERVGAPKAVRAVATACAKNPISVIIPCHRVVPKAGGIGKYRWGSEMKAKLIKRETFVA